MILILILIKNISDNLLKTIKNKRNKKEDITKLLTTLNFYWIIESI